MGDLGAQWTALAGALGYPPSPTQVEQIEALARLLREWNQAHSLVADGESDDAGLLHKHFLDSLAFVPVLGETEGPLADLGSGGGLPGLVLKIACPALPVTLIESHQRRAQFLEEAGAELGLTELTVLPQRTEEVGRAAAHRERYQRVTARRLAELAVLCEYGLPLLAVGGRAVFAKGLGLDDELIAAAGVPELLGGAPAELVEVPVPGGAERRRQFVTITKMSPTPDKYPRPPGRPAKRPLRVGG